MSLNIKRQDATTFQGRKLTKPRRPKRTDRKGTPFLPQRGNISRAYTADGKRVSKFRTRGTSCFAFTPAHTHAQRTHARTCSTRTRLTSSVEVE